MKICWPVPDCPVELKTGEVHLWAASLCPPLSFIQEARKTLSEEEQQRAERFSREELRLRFVAGRGILRRLLAEYLKVPPATVRLGYGPHEKPCLDMGPETSRLNFNLSHSGELAIFGFVWDSLIGVDIEKCRPMPSAERIVARYFSESEKQQFLSLPCAEKQEGFFECFTRKEAFAKALGTGMATPFSSFDVSLGKEEQARLIAVRKAGEDASQWTLRSFGPAESYLGAAAIKARKIHLRKFRYPDSEPRKEDSARRVSR